MVRTIAVDPSSPDVATIHEAARLLRGGGLVAFPTETVYGLGARGLDGACVRRIFAAKGRPGTHPLILHVTDLAMAALLVRSPADLEPFARRFWPGPLTLVAERSALVPPEITGGGETVALRAPSHPVALALLRALGEPIAAPSANRYQTLSPTLASHVLKSLGDAVDLVLDGGACPEGLESTVLDVTASPPRVLRPGALPLALLREVDPRVEYIQTTVAVGPRASPGLDARHYAPRIPLRLASSAAELLANIASARGRGGRVAVLARDGDIRALGPAVSSLASLVSRLPDEPIPCAAALYAALHAIEDADTTEIHALLPPDADPWTPIRDRLLRASHPG